MSAGRVGRRRILGLSLAAGVGVAGSLVPSLDRGSYLLWHGVTGAEAVERLQIAVDAYLAAAQSLVYDDRSWEVGRQALGLSIAVEHPITSNPLPIGRPPAVLVATVDRPALARAMAGIMDLEQPAVDARLSLSGVDADVIPDRPGRRLEFELLAVALVEQARLLDDSALRLPMTMIPAQNEVSDLEPVAGWLDRVLSRPLTFSDTPGPIAIAPVALAGALLVEPDGDVTPNMSAWERLVAPLVAATAVAPVEPSIRLANGRAELAGPRPGQALDIGATIDAAWTALKDERRTVLPVVKPVPPQRRADDLSPTLAHLTRLLTRPPTLVAAEASLQLTAADMEQLLLATQPVAIDPTAADAVLVSLAALVDVAPQLPSYRWRDGQAVAQGASTPGRQLDRVAGREAMARGLSRGDARIALPVIAAQPVVPIGDLDFPHVLAEGRTYFADSARERYTNVALGLKRIDGMLVAPGEAFSFNQASGPVTYATGFLRGYGIAISNGKVTTLPSVGGGICQVATTVFHAAFRAGMPITDRSWHLYWMPRYGRPPSGVIGLDATVDDQSNLDFGFVNATEHWLRVEALVEGGDAVVRLRGVDPGWRVTVDPPVITNVVRASQVMTERQDASLPRGSRIWVEHAEDGKTVTIGRTVVDDQGQQRERRAFVSRYAPAANVTLVGIG